MGKFGDEQSTAFYLHNATVRGRWILNQLQHAALINASHADFAVLIDDLAAWKKGRKLDGLRYGAFGGSAPTDASGRIEWLYLQSDDDLGDKEFRPQPWRQLQRVLREMGHTEDAKQVGVAY